MLRLEPDRSTVGSCHRLAESVARSVNEELAGRSTVTIERTVARLFGVDGLGPSGIPLANTVVDHLISLGKLEEGVALRLANASLVLNATPAEVAEKIAAKKVDLGSLPWHGTEACRAKAGKLAAAALSESKTGGWAAGFLNAPRSRQSVALRDRRHRRHTRRHHPGEDGRGARRRCHRRNKVNGPESPRLCPPRGNPRRIRRDVRYPGELQAHARGSRRRVQAVGKVYKIGELLLRALHAGDRRYGCPGALGHYAERRHVRHFV